MVLMVMVADVVVLVVCLTEGLKKSPGSLSAVIPREAEWPGLPRRATHRRITTAMHYRLWELKL